MAKIKQKTFVTEQRAIHVLVEDDFGHEHHVQVKLGLNRCPCCKRDYPRTEDGFPDTGKIVAEVSAQLDQEFDRLLPHLKAEGADVTAHEARRDENRNSKGNGGGHPATESVTGAE